MNKRAVNNYYSKNINIFAQVGTKTIGLKQI